VLVEGVVPIRPESALFEAMLEGWRRQQSARRLSAGVVDGRERLVRRFQEFTGVWPWQWSPAQVDSWVASGEWAHSTVRSYQPSSVTLAFQASRSLPAPTWAAESSSTLAPYFGLSRHGCGCPCR
jgi:hypothetical protein